MGLLMFGPGRECVGVVVEGVIVRRLFFLFFAFLHVFGWEGLRDRADGACTGLAGRGPRVLSGLRVGVES